MNFEHLPPEQRALISEVLTVLNQAGVHYVVSGAVAFGYYTGIWRNTKDFDVFLRRIELTAALLALATHGYVVETPSQHWLSHAFKGHQFEGSYYLDLIHGFGGWRAQIDRAWWERGQPAEMLGVPVRVAPVEDLLWMKSYVAHRERFDLADVAHLIRACHASMDWRYLRDRYGPGWQLLAFYVNLYDFIYPGHRDDIPTWLREDLLRCWDEQQTAPAELPPVCRGTLLDRFSFLSDVNQGWRDGRVYWAEQQGWSERDVAEDRTEAEDMLARGKVQPAQAA